ncbi:MAG: branched-chain amino acid ABC transporter permease [Chloroflexi bacterium]|nr:branched-chain amino acid ABC transporter permease [Chloroflexota bacterium]
MLIELTIGGLALGGIYALIAFALSLTLSTTRVLNVAHGDFLVLGSAASVFLMRHLELDPFVSLAGVALIFAAVGFIFERALVGPILGKKPEHILIGSILITFGLALSVESSLGTAWAAWVDPQPQFTVDPFLPRFQIGQLSISGSRATIIIFVALAIVAFSIFLRKTYVGKSARALAQNYEGSMVVGINTRHVSAVIFGTAIMTSALAGLFYAAAAPLEPYSGLPLTIKALTVVILAGVGSLPGALIAGAVLGLAETFTGFFVGAHWSPVVAIALLFIILVVKPTGLMGKEAL